LGLNLSSTIVVGGNVMTHTERTSHGHWKMEGEIARHAASIMSGGKFCINVQWGTQFFGV